MTVQRALVAALSPAPIGYFVHHQGRGHAERCAAIVNALPATRPVTVFCARDDIFPALRRGVEVVKIPSLFEPTGRERGLDSIGQPNTVHCAPVGWPGIRKAMGMMAEWFARRGPAVMISDVSAEVAQLARLCSVPHICVLQHGDRSDPGHMAAYDGAAALIAPFSAALAQNDWTDAMRRKTHFAAGLGVRGTPKGELSRQEARAALGLPSDRRIVLLLSGAGGSGLPSAPLAVGARSCPDTLWITLGRVARDWHATEPKNLIHRGWVDDVAQYLTASDLVVSSAGNTTCHQVLQASRPWVVVPEWRYFDEQVHKARALARAGAATHCAALPSSIGAWLALIDTGLRDHDASRQAALLDPRPDLTVATWLERLAGRLTGEGPSSVAPLSFKETTA